MEHRPPTPICHCFLPCRQLILDQYTQDYIIVAPAHQVVSFTYPVVGDLSFYGRCSSVQGTYHLELQLQDLEGNAVWRHPFEPPLQSHDPLQLGILALPHVQLVFPKPGKYELVLLANGEEMVRDMIWAQVRTAPVVQ